MNVQIHLEPMKLQLEGAVAELKMRKELYMLMYDVAKKHRDEANSLNGKNQNEEIESSMVSILFCYTCLEAFINTIGKDKLKSEEWAKYEDASTEGKWMGISNKLASKKYETKSSIFSNNKEPFKSFLELEIIREQFLVHRKANFDDIVKTKYGNTEGTVNTLNNEKADWACLTVQNMVKTLADNINDAPSITWVE